MSLTIPTLSNSVLADKAFENIQSALTSNFSWLTYAFGKSFPIVEKNKHSLAEYITPCAYTGNNKYYPMLPNTELDNHSFFVLIDPEEEVTGSQSSFKFRFRAGLIVWCNLKTVYPSETARATENLKNDIIEVLRGVRCSNGSFRLGRIYEDFKNVYREWSVKEIENQYVMHPYAAIRIELDFTVKNYCS